MPRDTCANYNAFGRDPHGLVAHLAEWFFGPDWLPPFPRQVFGGRPEPPRYGPPAAYQLDCLPPGFVPNPPPEYFGRPISPFLQPRSDFDLECFDAVIYSNRFAYLELGEFLGRRIGDMSQCSRCAEAESDEDRATEIDEEEVQGDEDLHARDLAAAERSEVKDVKEEPKRDMSEAREEVELEGDKR